MRPADIADLLKSLAIDVREYIAQAIAPLSTKLAELQSRVDAIPPVLKGDPGERGESGERGEKGEPGLQGVAGDRGTDGFSAFELAQQRGFTGTEGEWLESLRGVDGKSANVAEIVDAMRDDVAVRRAIEAAVAEVERRIENELIVASLKPPAEPKGLTADDVRPIVKGLVEEEVAAFDLPTVVRELVDAIPKPADGKSVSAEDVLPLIEQLVFQIPKPADGKSVTVEDVQPLLDDLVHKAVEALPPPAAGKDGASVTVEDVRPIVEQTVERIVAAQRMSFGEALDAQLLGLAEAVKVRFSDAHAG